MDQLRSMALRACRRRATLQKQACRPN